MPQAENCFIKSGKNALDDNTNDAMMDLPMKKSPRTATQVRKSAPHSSAKAVKCNRRIEVVK